MGINKNMETILSYFSDNPWFAVVTTFIAFASALAAATPTPKEGTILAKIYKVIDLAAINISHAKEKGTDDEEKK
jgi:uncharacterized membrane protein